MQHWLPEGATMLRYKKNTPTFSCLRSGVANDFVLLGDVLREHDSFIFRDRNFIGIFRPWIGGHHAISKGSARCLVQEERRLQIDHWDNTKHCKTQKFVPVFLIFVVPCIMLYIGEISPTRCSNCVFIRNGFTLHVSGDNLTHHQEYNAVYGHRW